jgi:hypothetical protein
MTIRFAYIVALTVLLAGCAADGAAPQPAPQANSSWLLLASPTSSDFPQGQLGLPLSRWTRVQEYPSYEQCDASEQKARNEMGRVVDCIASDDPRLKSID